MANGANYIARKLTRVFLLVPVISSSRSGLVTPSRPLAFAYDSLASTGSACTSAAEVFGMILPPWRL